MGHKTRRSGPVLCSSCFDPALYLLRFTATSHIHWCATTRGAVQPVKLARVLTLMTLRPNTAASRRSITTLYVGGLDAGISEDDIRDVFYAYGELASVRKVRREGRKAGLAVEGVKCGSLRNRVGCCQVGS